MSDEHKRVLEESKRNLMNYVAQIHKTSMDHCHLDVSLFKITLADEPTRTEGDRTKTTVDVEIDFGKMNRDLMDCMKFGIENTPELIPGLKQVILASWQKRYDSLIR